MTTATLIYNPIAGRHPARRRKQIQEIAAVLRASSIAPKLAPTSQPGTAGELARAAVRQGDDLILVCGGDGTLNEVVNGITPGKVPLGILPGGTANIAAKELGLPRDPVDAARQLPAWSRRRIAVGLATWPGAAPPDETTPERKNSRSAVAPAGEVGQEERRYFLSIAGIGFDAYVVHRLSWDLKMSAGVAAYILEALRQAWRYSFPSFHCVVKEGKDRAPCRGDAPPRQETPHQGAFTATFAVVHRTSRYAGWLHLAPTASLHEARLGLCLFKSAGLARYILYAAAAVARQHLRLNDVEFVETHKVVCAATGPRTAIYFQLDGELVGQLPATFEVVPDALTLLMP